MASAAYVDERAALGDGYLAELNQRFESQPASAIIRWAVDTFHPHLCMTASMTDAVLIVVRDLRGLVKINPLATWTDLDVAGYVKAHDVPVNPLIDQGYPSIGCWPCTKPVSEGDDARAGRWAGSQKTECGLHL